MKSCFAYRETVNDDNTITESCRCFEIMLCKYKECSMKKTANEFYMDLARAKIRNKKLGLEKAGRRKQ